MSGWVWARGFAVLVLAATVSLFSIRGASALDIAVADEALIANPDGAAVTIIYDLAKSRAELQPLPEAERAGFAKAFAQKVLTHWLASATPEEAGPVQSATVVLVYIEKRDEYDEPDLSSLVELGVAKMGVASGKASSEPEISGALAF